MQVFEGNTDSYAVKHSYLDEAVVARFIKFHTVHWNRHPSMRVEIIGCQGMHKDGREMNVFTSVIQGYALVGDYLSPFISISALTPLLPKKPLSRY